MIDKVHLKGFTNYLHLTCKEMGSDDELILNMIKEDKNEGYIRNHFKTKKGSDHKINIMLERLVKYFEICYNKTVVDEFIQNPDLDKMEDFVKNLRQLFKHYKISLKE
jgi:hypothetical protein